MSIRGSRCLGFPIHRARCLRAVQCRGACAVDARRLSFEVLLGSERWQGTPFADPRGQMHHTVPAMKSFATGISPEKAIVSKEPDVVSRAPAIGMSVTPYTFRASAVTGYPNVRAEMVQFIDRFGVDGVITDNPDKAPGR